MHHHGTLGLGLFQKFVQVGGFTVRVLIVVDVAPLSEWLIRVEQLGQRGSQVVP